MTENKRKHTPEKIKQNGEVFTPEPLVNQMLDKLPQGELLDPLKIIGDISGCGNGNFLFNILERRIAAGISHKNALQTLYGVDIDETNVFECKQRLALGSRDTNIWKILDRNIICADALNKSHPGWRKVGYMWDPLGNPAEHFKLENIKDLPFVKRTRPKKKPVVVEDSPFLTKA